MTLPILPLTHTIFTPNITLIGISGYAGSGKDSVATYLQKSLSDSYIHAWALFLKDACTSAFGIDFLKFNDSALKELPDPYWNVSPRSIAQFFGTELFRDKLVELIPDLNHDFWVRRLIGYINGHIEPGDGWMPYGDGDTIIIPDTRFQNEYNCIIGNGGYHIHVQRDGHGGNVGIAGHASEAGFQIDGNHNIWQIVNDGTLEEMYLEVDKFMDHFKLRSNAMDF